MIIIVRDHLVGYQFTIHHTPFTMASRKVMLMDFLKRLSSLFALPSHSDRGRFHPITVKCDRCGEIVEGQINIGNDLSIGDGENSDAEGYYCRKVLIGSQRCFQQIEVQVRFDSNYQLIDRQVTGGAFVDGNE
jgi:hypothetical protein